MCINPLVKAEFGSECVCVGLGKGVNKPFQWLLPVLTELVSRLLTEHGAFIRTISKFSCTNFIYLFKPPVTHTEKRIFTISAHIFPGSVLGSSRAGVQRASPRAGRLSCLPSAGGLACACQNPVPKQQKAMTDADSVTRSAAVCLDWSGEKLPPATPCIALGCSPFWRPSRHPSEAAPRGQTVRGNSRDGDCGQQ